MFIRSSVTGAASPGVSGALNAKTARKMRSWRVDLPSVCQPLCRSGLEAEEPGIARPLFDPVLSSRKSKSSQWGCVANMDYARSPTSDRGTRVYRAHRLQFHRQPGVWISRNAHRRCSVGRTPLLVFSVERG